MVFVLCSQHWAKQKRTPNPCVSLLLSIAPLGRCSLSSTVGRRSQPPSFVPLFGVFFGSLRCRAALFCRRLSQNSHLRFIGRRRYYLFSIWLRLKIQIGSLNIRFRQLISFFISPNSIPKSQFTVALPHNKGTPPQKRCILLRKSFFWYFFWLKKSTSQLKETYLKSIKGIK